MKIIASNMHYKALNEMVRNSSKEEFVIEGCMGQRYIGTGLSTGSIKIYGIAGNALGAYLDGASITVFGSAQDSIGDTMNDGFIFIHGSCGDTPGYAMRGGKIFIKGDAGYRAGIHMKAYEDKLPVLIIGGNAGSFLGEYQAGGRIIVLNLNDTEKSPVGYFCGTGMHGGKIFLRCNTLPANMPQQVNVTIANANDLKEIEDDVAAFCNEFSYNKEMVFDSQFYVLTPNTKNPYKQLYTHC